MQLNPAEISDLIKAKIENLSVNAEVRTRGTVVSVTDGIVRIHGLSDAMQGEMLEFPGNTFGLAMNLERDSVGAVVLGNALEFYDFTVYAFFAKPIGEAFFPANDPTHSLLASLALFGIAMLVMPSLDMVRRNTTVRIDPLIEATPALRDLVSAPRSRDAGNSLFRTSFPGGQLVMTGANSAVGLRSTPVRYLFLDEVDAYPGDLDGEGDPIALAEARTISFGHRSKVFLASTPTVNRLSRIEREYGLVLAGAADRFARDLPALTRLEEDSVRALRADVAHPQAGGDPDAWWHLLTAGWAATGRIVPALREPTGPEDTAFDRLTAPADVVAARRDALAAELTAAGRDVPRVSIVVCTHEPGPFLATAMASLRDQTWPDLEVVLVDDGSSPEGASAVEEAAAIVPGCRVLHLPRNVGAFAARNAGFAATTGDLLGNLDSDDWNHPERVERQVLPMLDDPAVVATESGALRALPDLRTTWLGYPATRVNASSTLVRREVHEAIGWFDSARRGGDAELQERIDRRYPGGRHVVDEVLSITRLRDGSLSRADFRMGWARAPWIVHQSAYRAWHGRLPAGPPTAVEGGAGEVAAREADGGAGVWPRLDGSGQRRFALPRLADPAMVPRLLESLRDRRRRKAAAAQVPDVPVPSGPLPGLPPPGQPWDSPPAPVAGRIAATGVLPPGAPGWALWLVQATAGASAG